MRERLYGEKAISLARYERGYESERHLRGWEFLAPCTWRRSDGVKVFPVNEQGRRVLWLYRGPDGEVDGHDSHPNSQAAIDRVEDLYPLSERGNGED